MDFSKIALKILVCPKCDGEVGYDEENLVFECESCKFTSPANNHIKATIQEIKRELELKIQEEKKKLTPEQRKAQLRAKLNKSSGGVKGGVVTESENELFLRGLESMGMKDITNRVKGFMKSPLLSMIENKADIMQSAVALPGLYPNLIESIGNEVGRKYGVDPAEIKEPMKQNFASVMQEKNTNEYQQLINQATAQANEGKTPSEITASMLGSKETMAMVSKMFAKDPAFFQSLSLNENLAKECLGNELSKTIGIGQPDDEEVEVDIV